MRPTTKDLAKAAGVSLATVDRVLNGRSGVRKKTVDAVNDAIKKIGFERNQLAATLARKRGYRFGFVLPKEGDEFLEEILVRIREANITWRAEMIEVKAIRIDEHDPHKAALALSKVSTKDFDGVAVMAPETPQIRDAIKRMRERDIMTIPFIANQQDIEKDNFVGINNRAAGATAGRLMGRFSCGRTGTVAVINDTMQSRDSLERRLGFDAISNQFFSNLTILPSLETFGDPERTHKIIETTLNANANLLGVYIIGSEARVPLEAMERLGHDRHLTVLAHERTPSTTSALKKGTLAAIITQDTGHLVRSAVRILRAKCENRSALASQERIRIEILIAENL
ncbi:MAG: LacI family DNA-binding transcriptional regulator [Magnetovibrio sp.]|nr:LacI family DNA-binding transcriptional regulator [Magnetovibrio sp.]